MTDLICNKNINFFGCHIKRHPIVLYCLLAVTLIFALGIACLGQRKGYTLEASLVIFVMGTAVAGVELLTWVLIFGKQEKSFSKASGPALLVRLLLASFLIGLFLEILTVVTNPYAGLEYVNKYDIVRILVFSFWTYLFLLIGEFFLFGFLANKLKVFSQKEFRAAFAKKALFLIFLTVTCSLIGGFAGLVSGFPAYSTSLFGAAIGLAVATLILCRKKIYDNLHWIFLSVGLALGILLIFTQPLETGASWDDDTHFVRSNMLSFVVNPIYTEADDSFSYFRDCVCGVSKPYSRENSSFLNKSIWLEENITYIQQCLSVDSSEVSCEISNGVVHYATGDNWSIFTFNAVGSVPAAIGLWFGRIVSNNFLIAYVMGKLFNLIFYLLVMTIAIRLIPVKKLVILSVGSFPTAIFLASNYAYDPFILAFITLGFALILRAKFSESCISGYMWTLILIIMFLGLCVKAVYFPLYGLLLLLPSKKFKTKKAYKLFVASVFVFLFLTIVSFVAPFASLSAIGEAGDTRGGSDINSLGQIAFILADFPRYLSIFFNFMIGTYLPFDASNAYSYFYAFLSNTSSLVSIYLYLAAILLALSSFLDVNRLATRLYSLIDRFWVFVIFASGLFLVATALYVSFTPLGAGGINGCQGRYILPLLIPFIGITCHFDFKFNKFFDRTCSILTLGVLISSFASVFTLIFIG